MKRILILSFLVLSAMGGLAQSQRGPRRVYDHSTRPNDFYLYQQDVPSSVKLLPPPPDSTSARATYDREQFDWGMSVRKTERGKLAVKDADSSAKGVVEAMSPAFGIKIDSIKTPQIWKLVTNCREDFGALSTGEAKRYYHRTRPFDYYHEDSAIPEVQKYYHQNGSYPSGHTAIGWGEALVLAEINVMNQNAILKRGYEYGQSRVIAGFHYQSDVDAARWLVAGTVARLHADEGFCKQMKKAKKEFKKLCKKGLIKKVEF